MYVDILGNNSNRLGKGPITTGVRWRYTQRLSLAGEWSFEVPAAEERLEFAKFKKQMHCYDYVGSTLQWMGGGALERKQVAVSAGDASLLSMSGNDVLYDLSRATVNIEINYNSPYIGEAMFAKIMSFAPPGWSITVDDETPDLIASFVNESVLNALVTICAKTGQMFRLDPQTQSDGTINFKRIKVFSKPESSGILATNQASPLAISRNPNACEIVDINQQEDAFSLVNLAIPYGNGTGQARFTPYGATLWPDGNPIGPVYTTTDISGKSHAFQFGHTQYDDGSYSPWFISDASSYLEYEGEDFVSEIQFKDIKPATSNPGDIAAASNALVLATINWLMNHSFPQQHFSLSVAGLRKQVFPGQTIRVVAKQMREGKTPINIDTNLIILEVVNEIDADGIKPVALTVSTSKEFAQTDAQVLAKQIQQSLAFQSHPQMAPNEWTIPYREDIDADHGTSFDFWLSRSTMQINSVVVRFKLDKLRSTVKSVGKKDVPFYLPDHKHEINIKEHTHVINPSNIHIPIASDTSGTAAPAYITGPIGGDYVLSTPTLGTQFLKAEAVGGGITAPHSEDAKVTSGSLTKDDAKIDLSKAIDTIYGIYEDTVAPYLVSDLAWTANGTGISASPTSIAGGWYALDVTSFVIAPNSLLPLLEANSIGVRVVTPKVDTHVRITVQIEVRNVIQSTVVV